MKNVQPSSFSSNVRKIKSEPDSTPHQVDAPVEEDGAAYLATALSGMKISRDTADVLVRALSLIAKEQVDKVAEQHQDDVINVSSDDEDTSVEACDASSTCSVVSGVFLTAPTTPGKATLSGPPLPSILLPPPPPPAPQCWHRHYRGYVYNWPAPNEEGPFYCVTKGTRVGIFTDWQRTSDLTQGVSRAAQSKFKILSNALSVFERALECGAVEIMVKNNSAVVD